MPLIVKPIAVAHLNILNLVFTPERNSIPMRLLILYGKSEEKAYFEDE